MSAILNRVFQLKMKFEIINCQDYFIVNMGNFLVSVAPAGARSSTSKVNAKFT